MCIAILNKSNKVSFTHFNNSLSNNPDVFGMAWVENGEIKTFKSLSQKAQKLYSKYETVYNKTEFPIILHFRIATSGGVNLFNCHPFNVSKSLVFCHNGIITGLGTTKESDTREFNNTILKHIPENLLLNNFAIQDLIADRIGYSKLVFLSVSGETSVINPHLGTEEIDGNWYSNDSYSYNFSYYDKWTKGKSTKKSGYIETADTGKDYEDSYRQCESCLQLGLTGWNREFKMNLCKDCQGWFEYEQAKKFDGFDPLDY